MTEFAVVCTDRGQHSQVTLGRLTWDGTQPREILTRVRQSGVTGPDVSARTVEALEPALSFHEGAERWRWPPCPRCRRDARLDGQHLRAWLINTQERSLDVSLLPSG